MKYAIGFGDALTTALSQQEREEVRIRIRIFPHPVLAGLEIFRRDGLKNLDGRRRRSRLVSRFSVSPEYFKEPRSGPDCESPFFSLGFFGEAKKSKSPAGASPGGYVKDQRYQFRSYSRLYPLDYSPKRHLKKPKNA